jgi:hypothetical protein
MTRLTSTLRLQFHKDFTLDDAVPLVPYFAALGISHVYASPLLKARPGSMHGYDVVDPTTVNPELGGEDALRRLGPTQPLRRVLRYPMALHRPDAGRQPAAAFPRQRLRRGAAQR